MSADVSVLVVTGSPDDRASTANLDLILDELESRPDVRTSLWYLRAAPHQRPRADARIVDALRTWRPAALLDGVGMQRPAAWLRGRRLRWWMREVVPDVVVLDDGLGARVLDGLGLDPRVVIRRNDAPPEHPHLEPEPATTADLVIRTAAIAAAEGIDADRGDTIEYPFQRPFRYLDGLRFADPAVRDAARTDQSLPTGVPLVVGWGDDGWLDGPDLFIRVLWALEHRFGLLAHGAWFGLTTDPHEVDRLLQEARRCGVEDRFHHRPADRIEGRLCGDAVLLPYRSETAADDVLEATCTGAVVVTFTAAGVHDPLVDTVADLDVEDAAARLAPGLRGDDVERVDRSVTSLRHFEPGPLVDDLLALGRRRGTRAT